MNIDLDSFQIATILITIANLAATYIAEHVIIHRTESIKVGVLHNDEEVDIKDAPIEIQNIAEAIIDGDKIKIKMTCNLIRLHIAMICSLINILIILGR